MKLILLLGVFFPDTRTIELHVDHLEVNHYSEKVWNFGFTQVVEETQLIVWNKGEYVDNMMLFEGEWKPYSTRTTSPMILRTHGYTFRIYYKSASESWTPEDPVHGMDGNLFFPDLEKE